LRKAKQTDTIPAMPDASLKNAPTACDAVTLEIVRGAVRAAQAEMEALIERTAISAFIREKKDFYTALFDADGTMLVVREDIGRHNAVDKVIGWAVEQGRIPLSGTVLLVSGRASFELTQKAIMAGIPVLAAVSAPSSLAVDLASQAGLTLVAFLRGESMNVYTRQDRVKHAG